MTSNQIAYFKAREEQRTNLANEGIKERANQINYGNMLVNQRQASAAEQNAATNSINAQLRAAELNEAMRSNMAREAENQRSNMAREYETMRSNMAQESINSWYNQQKVSQGEASLWHEAKRTNVEQDLKQASLAEEKRHNMATEGATKAGVVQKAVETIFKGFTTFAGFLA